MWRVTAHWRPACDRSIRRCGAGLRVRARFFSGWAGAGVCGVGDSAEERSVSAGGRAGAGGGRTGGRVDGGGGAGVRAVGVRLTGVREKISASAAAGTQEQLGRAREPMQKNASEDDAEISIADAMAFSSGVIGLDSMSDDEMRAHNGDDIDVDAVRAAFRRSTFNRAPKDPRTSARAKLRRRLLWLQRAITDVEIAMEGVFGAPGWTNKAGELANLHQAIAEFRIKTGLTGDGHLVARALGPAMLERLFRQPPAQIAQDAADDGQGADFGSVCNGTSYEVREPCRTSCPLRRAACWPCRCRQRFRTSEIDPLSPDFPHPRRALVVGTGGIGHCMHDVAGFIDCCSHRRAAKALRHGRPCREGTRPRRSRNPGAHHRRRASHTAPRAPGGRHRGG